MSTPPLRLFEAIGLELEYMIVDRTTLNVRPIADQVLAAAKGRITSDVELGAVTWSNELALHVIELKGTDPARQVEPFVSLFQEHIARINAHLEPLHARLMPTAMHPWMDPDREMRLWPHEFNAVYEAFDRIFSTRGHGWANLQSFHINLPFANDEEFARLHRAIRHLLPIMPALTASSPVLDGRLTGLLDNRLEVYRHNSAKIPAITGQVVPEEVYSRADYDKVIFEPMYAAIAPHDPDKILQNEWLNARGAIARFKRNAIEIRVLDVQECPAADLAIAAALTTTLDWLTRRPPPALTTESLHRLLLKVIRDAEEAVIDEPAYLNAFDFPRASGTAGELWRHIADRWLGDTTLPFLASVRTPALDTILEHGPLARRIVRALAGDTTPTRLHHVYGQLCDCLQTGTLFQPMVSR